MKKYKLRIGSLLRLKHSIEYKLTSFEEGWIAECLGIDCSRRLRREWSEMGLDVDKVLEEMDYCIEDLTKVRLYCDIEAKLRYVIQQDVELATEEDVEKFWLKMLRDS